MAPRQAPTRGDAALALAREGFRVLRLHGVAVEGVCSCGDPECRSPGKHPNTGGTWRGTSTPETIQAWWRTQPHSNIGIATGPMTDGRHLVVLDLDGPEAIAKLEQLVEELGPLPETREVHSGRPEGGSHRYFVTDAEVGCRKLGKIDVKGAGGYVVAPPSLHHTGRIYAWANDAELAELPASWAEFLARPAGRLEVARPVEASISPRVAELLERDDRIAQLWHGQGKTSGDTSGSGYDASLAAALLRRGVPEDEIAAALLARPGVHRADPAYAAATVGNVSGHVSAERDDDRPTIETGVDLRRVADEAVEALARDPGTYQRDGKLVHVVGLVEPDDDPLTGRAPRIREIAAPTLKERLADVADWMRYDARSGDFRPCAPPDTIVQAVAHRGEWPNVLELVGVTEAPAMRPDGSIIQTPGYDAATGYLYVPSESYPQVPDAPTQAQATAALRALVEPWAEMEWTAEAHRYVGVAGVLALLARPAIKGAVPGLGLDASTRGAGKTLSARVISLIATGREPALLTWPHGRDDEAEKMLAALALRGARVVVFDNVEGLFGGAALDKTLTTADRVALRVLGRSEVPELAWRALIVATGNGLTLGGDTARRMLVARQEPTVERPEERTGWKHDPLDRWVTRERARLVVAGLTVMRGYIAAGRPDAGLKPWGSYEAFASLVPAAIRWAGGPDIMECRPSATGGDEEAVALATLLEGWSRIAPEGASIKSVLGLLYPPERLRGELTAPDGFDGLRDAIEHFVPPYQGRVPDVRKVGYVLRRNRGRVVGGMRLVNTTAHRGVKAWAVEVGR